MSRSFHFRIFACVFLCIFVSGCVVWPKAHPSLLCERTISCVYAIPVNFAINANIIGDAERIRTKDNIYFIQRVFQHEIERVFEQKNIALCNKVLLQQRSDDMENLANDLSDVPEIQRELYEEYVQLVSVIHKSLHNQKNVFEYGLGPRIQDFCARLEKEPDILLFASLAAYVELPPYYYLHNVNAFAGLIVGGVLAAIAATQRDPQNNRFIYNTMLVDAKTGQIIYYSHKLFMASSIFYPRLLRKSLEETYDKIPVQ